MFNLCSSEIRYYFLSVNMNICKYCYRSYFVCQRAQHSVHSLIPYLYFGFKDVNSKSLISNISLLVYSQIVYNVVEKS